MGNNNSTELSNTDSNYNAKQISALPTGASAGRQQTNIKQVQNVLLVWLDSQSKNNSEDCQNTVTQLRHVVNDINVFTDGKECFQFIEDINDNKICMIVSGSLGENIVPCVHNLPQMDSIFIFCGNSMYHKQWIKEWPKIKGVFTTIAPICEALRQASQQCEQNAISISLVATNGDEANKNLDRLDPMFMYSQIIKEILLTIDFGQKHFQEFIDYCCDAFVDNPKELKKIDIFKQTYRDKTPIWWYTYKCFLYSMLNQALRTSDVDTIILMGFFIDDLHRHIEKLHKEQLDSYQTGKTLTIYRGQGLSNSDFEHIKKTNGGLLSFNNFLSTSKNRNVSLDFARKVLTNPDLIGILFVMTIDPSKSTTPFASIKGISYFQNEDEVLFSMHTVFRIQDIKSMGENQRLIQVDLILADENDDKDLRQLADRFREETFPEEEGWYRLGSTLWKMGHFKKSEQIYQVLLDQATTESDKASICHQIGLAKRNQGEYKEAIKYYEISLEIYKKTRPLNHPDLAASYNNIGSVYHNMSKYWKALWYYEKALVIRQQSLHLNHPNLAASYNNIGLMYYNMSEYLKALSYYEKSLAIKQQSLPSNHPSLTASYNNIGLVYYKMNDYSKALSYYEKALAINQKILPSNHSDLAASYNNIGKVHYNMNDYSKALSYYEKALAIKQQSLPPNHPGLANSHNNIGQVYFNMAEYSKALSYYEKALEIRQQSLLSNHPDLVASYNNIGGVYYVLGEYSKALSYSKKSLLIKEQSVPSDHPSLAELYNNIGEMYFKAGEYSNALLYHEKALEIRQQSVASNHPDVVKSYNNIGKVYYNMSEYSKALPYYGTILAIKQQSLPSNHPDLASTYNNIGLLYYHMHEYWQALSFHEKALAIQQQSLSSNHPDLAASYNSIGDVYRNMKEHSKARSYFQRAVNIGQQSLPPNDLNLQRYKNNLEDIEKEL